MAEPGSARDVSDDDPVFARAGAVVSACGAAGSSLAALLASWCGACGAVGGVALSFCAGLFFCVFMLAIAAATSVVLTRFGGAPAPAGGTSFALPAVSTSGNFMLLPRDGATMHMTMPWLWKNNPDFQVVPINAVSIQWVATRTWLDTVIDIPNPIMALPPHDYNNTAFAEVMMHMTIDWTTKENTNVIVDMDGMWYPTTPGMPGWVQGMSIQVAGGGGCTGYDAAGPIGVGAVMLPFFKGFSVSLAPASGHATYTCTGRFFIGYGLVRPDGSPYDGRLP